MKNDSADNKNQESPGTGQTDPQQGTPTALTVPVAAGAGASSDGRAQAQSAPPPSPPIDTGLACLSILGRIHGVQVDADKLRHELALGGRLADAQAVLEAARLADMKGKLLSCNWERLAGLPLPAIACLKDGSFLILGRADDGQGKEAGALIQRVDRPAPDRLSRQEFETIWNGQLILLSSRASAIGALAQFDFSWFVPSLYRYRRELRDVVLGSTLLQLFALATPLLFQLVMDKVLVHQAYTTLTVLAIALLLSVVFESALSIARTYLLSHTTTRIDVELGARLFRHLLRLPQAYFDARQTGDTVARVREVDTIRQFLTGQALTLVIDVAFTFVFIAVMAWYSGWLTLVVLASLPCYVVISAFIVPVLRARLQTKFQRNAEHQSSLIETVNAIGTVKAGALEPQTLRRFDEQLADLAAANFKVVRLASVGSETIQLVSKLVTVALLYFGARLVIEGELTVGQLVAFNMLAGRVAQPILRIAQSWNDFQQVGIAMKRLGDIFNTRPELEADKSTARLPRIRGDIRLDGVTFRYRPGEPEVLRQVSVNIKAGEVVGIVGRSGSGKSTLTKIIQRLYVPESGRVLVDGVDLSMVDVSWLRRQLGVVLQDNVLFSRSIRDNIAVADPGMPMERVVAAARLAGAHDFIIKLPRGYDTEVGEHGSLLSGGQRQRLALARALATQPRILVLDEATSALDYESEKILQDNLKHIVKDRTVVIVAHRLSAVRQCDRIIVMDEGRIIEMGDHATLVARGGLYAHLNSLQAG